MKRTGVFFAAALLCAASHAQTLPELFRKAKAEVKAESWTEALETLDALDAEAARPGNEAARQQLAAPTAFYRGVCDANLGNADRAEADFATFLRENPGATIDKTMYSKKAVAAFEAARKEAGFEAASGERRRAARSRFSRGSSSSRLRPTWARNRTRGGPTDRRSGS